MTLAGHENNVFSEAPLSALTPSLNMFSGFFAIFLHFSCAFSGVVFLSLPVARSGFCNIELQAALTTDVCDDNSVLCDVLLFLDGNDDGELSIFAEVSMFEVVVFNVNEGGDGGSGGVKGRALRMEHAVMGASDVFFLASVASV